MVQLSAYTWTLQQLRGGNRARILDAACGTGFGTHALAQSVFEAVGVDLAPEAIAEARARYRAPGLSYLVMDVAKLAFRGAIFDAVISQDTIEHVPDDESFVAEAARVLSPDGIFIVFTPYREVHTTTPENPYHLASTVRRPFGASSSRTSPPYACSVDARRLPCTGWKLPSTRYGGTTL